MGRIASFRKGKDRYGRLTDRLVKKGIISDRPGHMRFNPNVKLDPSQVQDMRRTGWTKTFDTLGQTITKITDAGILSPRSSELRKRKPKRGQV